jgi:hypothetical protein
VKLLHVNWLSKRPGVLTVIIFLAVLSVYVSLRTMNYYWDGIGISYDIEHADAKSLSLFHQNHLLYGPLGEAAWRAAVRIVPGARSLDTLQVLNAIFGAAAVAVFFRALLSTFRSTYVALCLALGLAFSATWWKFSTDADSYIPSAFFVIVALFAALPGKRARPVMLGCIHAFGMLLHQLAALFAPVLILALWHQQAKQTRPRRVAGIARYAFTAAAITISFYSAAFAAISPTFSFPEVLRWVTSYSNDVSFSFTLGKNLVTSVAGNMKLFLGGRLPLIWTVWNPRTALTAAALIGLTAVLLMRLRTSDTLKIDDPASYAARAGLVRMSILWVGIYCAFLLVWLPHNTFYRLFYLPALLLLAGTFLASTPERRFRLACAVAVMFLWNLGFHIYPYAQAQSNGALQMARTMQNIWPAGTFVYWDVHAADNRTIQYFNTSVRWKELWDRAWISDIQQTVDQANAQRKSLWFDLRALERFAATDPEFQAWLAGRCRLGPRQEFNNSDHKTAFVELACQSSAAD